MKLLFLEYNSYPIPDAVGNCANKLRRELFRQGVASDVLTFRWDRSLADAYRDDCGTVYLADSWMLHARVNRDPMGKITGSRRRLARAVCTKALAFLCGGRYVLEDKLPAAACEKFGKRLAALCGRERYDWVIACGSPFCVLWTAAAYTPANTKLALYYFDPPFFAIPGFSQRPARVRQRLNKELAAWERADCIVVAPEHRKLIENAAFDGVREKAIALPFPNLEIPREKPDGKEDQCPVAFEKEAINCVYLGTLYDGGREPEALLKLFCGMAEAEPRIRLYLIGDKTGAAVQSQVRDYAGRLGARLICMSAVPLREAEGVMRRADILINLGNRDLCYLPSKLFDLISLGKPILQLCMVRDCNTLPFILRYPKAFDCFADECGKRETAEAAARFCVKQAGTACEAGRLMEQYRGHTTHDVTARVLEELAKR